MANNVAKQDIHILEAFLEYNIPSYIREASINNWDLMECYEELFNYSHGMLSGHKVDISINSLGTSKAFVFDQEYKNILLNLSDNSSDWDLRTHCYLSLTVLSVLEKYTESK